MVLIENRSHLVFRGFEIRNLTMINDGSGIRILGAGENLEISHHRIYNMLGADAMGITVYGTEPQPIANLRIHHNWIYDCEPARSEALTLNGNIDGFEVDDNLVMDVNNIGIDFIGGETDINPDPTLVARNGVCRGNTVIRARSNYGGGYGAGIYVDGGSSIILERNEVTQCDLGIEIGAENAGTTTENVIVRNNWIHRNDKAGLVFGGFDATVGRAQNCGFFNNTLFENDTLGEGLGQLWIQYASQNRVENNIFVGLADADLTYSELGNTNNSLNYNFWYAPGTPGWAWQSQAYSSFVAFQAGSGQDAQGLFGNPQLLNPSAGDGHLQPTSPAINQGNPSAVPGEVGTVDFDGQVRQSGRIDIGMDEVITTSECLADLLPQWQATLMICGATHLNVPELVALVNGTCACPRIKTTTHCGPAVK